MRTMSIRTRAATAVALATSSGALALTLVTVSTGGTDCGTWIRPEWTESTARELVTDSLETADRARFAGQHGLADQSLALADQAAGAYRACDDTLDRRRALTLLLIALGLAGPAALLWITAGRPDRTPRDTEDTDRSPTGTQTPT